MASYHEFGDVLGNINLKAGNVVVEENCSACAIVINATASEIEAGTVSVSANNTSAPYVPIIVNEETLKAINQSEKSSISEKCSIIRCAQDWKYYSSTTSLGYATFAEAISATNANGIITVLKDDTFTSFYSGYESYGYMGAITKNMTINLNEHTLKSAYWKMQTKGDANVTIINGNLEGTGKGYGINVKENSKITLKGVTLTETDTCIQVEGNGSVTVGEVTKVVATSASGNYPAINLGDKDTDANHTKTLNIYGTIEANGLTAIQGNGTNRATSAINIFDGAVITSNSLLAYLPEPCVVNVYGGYLEGKSVFAVKSGTINVSGGTLKATASYEVEEGHVPVSKTSAVATCGAVIHVDSAVGQGYFGGINISISGGELISTNCYCVCETTNTPNETLIGSINITGGKFVSPHKNIIVSSQKAENTIVISDKMNVTVYEGTITTED